MTTMPKIGPKSRAAAQNEVNNLLRFIRDYRKCNRRAAMALREELHLAYCEANFNGTGDYIPSLDEADILKAVADMIERDYGMDVTTHRQLEESLAGRTGGRER